ncbi:MAG: MBL fold metallo-hydrolase [Acidimicrobiales bacterium]|jgi:glyoxylase-like metal-dependent hydrolase (beta-lactamase superfamily II)|nr:MBL fold metallo-hydrolase [Acidimicrobiales bacterium]MDP6298639.1 MBL fold metallo-hydrolase [Acidimicrobiales bacterium]HJM27729.1 MBL fold metallo-hydrolase [Acidimicrobiales bacterium]HJM98300.1 MBL fold metallo-hydrolase [Acidimicrobiales bacterium]
MTEDQLYFRQLLSGRDVGAENQIARQMVNFMYVIGDRSTGEAIVIDPAYDPQGLVDIVEEDGMKLTGVLATHYHPDHIGGDMMGFSISGITDLLELTSIPIHVQKEEAELVDKVTGVGQENLVTHESGDKINVGSIEIELIHTPGHTPGSQCFLVENRLVAGDTLFLDGCGRTDLPGGDPRQMYESLTKRLSKVPDDATLFPGHLYSPKPSQSMGETRQHNYVFTPNSPEQWMAMFGG